MKCFTVILLVLATVLSAPAARTTLEDIAPRFPTNAEIVWQATTNNLPQKLWVYKRMQRIFPAATISNAIVLGSLQSKGFPRPSTNDFFIWEDKGPNYPGAIPAVFSIRPAYATLAYSISNYDRGSGEAIPSDETVLTLAWKFALQLGLDTGQLQLKNRTSHICPLGENGRDNTNNQVCGRGAYLSRQVDGILFMGTGEEGWSDGFWIEFGGHDQIRAFSLNWPNLERYETCQIASPEQIVACIRAHKIFVLPKADDESYSERIKTLSTARRLTVTKITPYYSEGMFGETPQDNEPPKWVTPIVELEAVAEFGNSNTTVRIYSPILSSDVARLLTK
jgi:hypothetical protein